MNLLSFLDEEARFIANVFESELTKTKKELIESLYSLKENLHPDFLFTDGKTGTLKDLNWLLENRRSFFEKNYDFNYRLKRFSSKLSEILFGELLEDCFSNELLHSITSSTLRKSGIKSFSEKDEVLVNFLDERISYKFSPYSGLEKEGGKILDEYYSNEKLVVEVGIRPLAFRSISVITLPSHEILHHLSNLYTKNSFSSAIAKSFEESFSSLNIFKISSDRGIVFGFVSEDASKKLRERGIDLRGKDLLNPFVLSEIFSRHGEKICSALKISSLELNGAMASYLKKYLPFRVLEEGLACYLSVENACIDEIPPKFSGMENSLREIVKFGSLMKKFEYLENGIDFYGGKTFSPYYIPEAQLYPLSYLYFSKKFGNKNALYYFEILKKYYSEKNVEGMGRIVRRKEEKDDVIRELRSTLNEYKKRIEEMDKLLDDCKRRIRREETINQTQNFIYIGSLMVYALIKALDSI